MLSLNPPEYLEQKMDDLSATDWENLSKYRKIYNREQQAKQALSMLEMQNKPHIITKTFSGSK